MENDDLDDYSLSDVTDKSEADGLEYQDLKQELENTVAGAKDESALQEERLGFLSQAKEIVLFRDRSANKSLLHEHTKQFLSFLELPSTSETEVYKIFILRFFEEAIEMSSSTVVVFFIYISKKFSSFLETQVYRHQPKVFKQLLVSLNNCLFPLFKLITQPSSYKKLSSSESVASDISMNSLNLNSENESKLVLTEEFVNNELLKSFFTVVKEAKSFLEAQKDVKIYLKNSILLGLFKFLETICLVCSRQDPKASVTSITGRKNNLRKDTGPTAFSLTQMEKSVRFEQLGFLRGKLDELDKLGLDVLPCFFPCITQSKGHIFFQALRSTATLFQHRRGLREKIMTFFDNNITLFTEATAREKILIKTSFRTCFLPLLKADFLGHYYDKLLVLLFRDTVLGKEDTYLKKTLKDLQKFKANKDKFDKNRFDLVLKQSNKFKADVAAKEAEEVQKMELQIRTTFFGLGKPEKARAQNALFQNLYEALQQKERYLRPVSTSVLLNRGSSPSVAKKSFTVDNLVLKCLILHKLPQSAEASFDMDQIFDLLFTNVAIHWNLCAAYLTAMFLDESEEANFSTLFKELLNRLDAIFRCGFEVQEDEKLKRETANQLRQLVKQLPGWFLVLTRIPFPNKDILKFITRCVLAELGKEQVSPSHQAISVFGFRILEHIATTNLKLQVVAIQLLLYFSLLGDRKIRTRSLQILINGVLVSNRKRKRGEIISFGREDTFLGAKFHIEQFTKALLSPNNNFDISFENIPEISSVLEVAKTFLPELSGVENDQKREKEEEIQETNVSYLAKGENVIDVKLSFCFGIASVLPGLFSLILERYSYTEDLETRLKILKNAQFNKLLSKYVRSFGHSGTISLLNTETEIKDTIEGLTGRRYEFITYVLLHVSLTMFVTSDEKAELVKSFVSNINLPSTEILRTNHVELFLGLLPWFSTKAVISGIVSVLSHEVFSDDLKVLLLKIYFKQILDVHTLRHKVKAENESEVKEEQMDVDKRQKPTLNQKQLLRIIINLLSFEDILTEDVVQTSDEMDDDKEEKIPEIKPENGTSIVVNSRLLDLLSARISSIKLGCTSFFSTEQVGGVKILGKDDTTLVMDRIMTVAMVKATSTKSTTLRRKTGLSPLAFHIVLQCLKLHPQLKAHSVGIFEKSIGENVNLFSTSRFEGDERQNYLKLVLDGMWKDFVNCCELLQTPIFSLLLTMPIERLNQIKEENEVLFKSLKIYFKKTSAKKEYQDEVSRLFQS
eukprot:snap_masked-scaffold_15-processed-gene-4.32-mRNA-1 protein AED:1.00 eAED:1.00 QI:0/-1/0/0/-1/1/1/0/1245